MFRVISDPDFRFFYVHKKFLWWWIKWGCPKSNMVSDISHIVKIMQMGCYNFSPGEFGNFYFIMDRRKPKIEYFIDIEEFKEKYAEYLI